MADDLVDKIAENAQAPAQVTGDSGSMQQHPIPDQIAADRYAKSVRATSRTQRNLGIRLFKINQAGSV